MASKKSYCISVYLDVHQVTCPGVWLCPKGKIFLKASLFGVSDTTKKIDPVYPLVFNERFIFQKAFTGVSSFDQLEGALVEKVLDLELIQISCRRKEQVVLSRFTSPICHLLCPTSLPSGVGQGERPVTPDSVIDLLLQPSETYPGILGPKVNVSASVAIEEMEKYTCQDDLPNPLPTPSKGWSKRRERTLRQKKVCHSKKSLRCCCYRPQPRRQLASKQAVVQAPAKWRKCLSSSPTRSNSLDYLVQKPSLPKATGIRDVGASDWYGWDKEIENGDGTEGQRGRWPEKTGKGVGGRACCDQHQDNSHFDDCDCRICRKYRAYFKDNMVLPMAPAIKENNKREDRFERKTKRGRGRLENEKSEGHQLCCGGRRAGKTELGRKPEKPKLAPCTCVSTQPLEDVETSGSKTRKRSSSGKSGKLNQGCCSNRKETSPEYPSTPAACHCPELPAPPPPSIRSKSTRSGKLNQGCCSIEIGRLPLNRRESSPEYPSTPAACYCPELPALPPRSPSHKSSNRSGKTSSPRKSSIEKPYSPKTLCCKKLDDREDDDLGSLQSEDLNLALGRSPLKHVECEAQTEPSWAIKPCKCGLANSLPSSCCDKPDAMKTCETYRHLFYENLETFYRSLLENAEKIAEGKSGQRCCKQRCKSNN